MRKGCEYIKSLWLPGLEILHLHTRIKHSSFFFLFDFLALHLCSFILLSKNNQIVYPNFFHSFTHVSTSAPLLLLTMHFKSTLLLTAASLAAARQIPSNVQAFYDSNLVNLSFSPLLLTSNTISRTKTAQTQPQSPTPTAKPPITPTHTAATPPPAPSTSKAHQASTPT